MNSEEDFQVFPKLLVYGSFMFSTSGEYLHEISSHFLNEIRDILLKAI